MFKSDLCGGLFAGRRRVEFRQHRKFEAKHTWEITAQEFVQGRSAYRLDITEEITSGPERGLSTTASEWIGVVNDTLLKIDDSGLSSLGPGLFAAGTLWSSAMTASIGFVL